MVQIKRIVSSGQISDFRGSAPDAGGGFRLLADGFDALYDRVLPIAVKQESDKGAADFRGLAKAQIGGNGYSSSSGSGAGVSDQRVVDAMVARGWSPHAAEGVAWNLHDESRFNTEAVGDNGNAFGLAQWNGPRKKAYLDFAAARGSAPGDFETQMDFLDHELRTSHKSAGEALTGASNASEAAVSFLTLFERPAKVHQDARAAKYSGGKVTMSSSGSEGSAFTPTMLRDADGALVSKLYDPSSDPIKQAYNMAAMSGYQSEIFLKSTADLMAMREQFAQDPDGFMQAAEAYMDGIVEKAPTLFQTDMRDGLTKEAQQVFLGLLDDQHRDIRQRASNSNQALIEKWSDGLGAAIAGGDPKEIAAAQSQLTSALALRERLPGLSWTPEQSDNVMQKAHEDGQRRIEKKRKDQESGWKKILSTITDAAKAGMTAANEDILDNPGVASLFPAEVREALAFTTLRDQMPSFMRMSPKDQAAAIAEQKTAPIQEDWEVDLWGAADKAAADNAKRWIEDPMKRAAEVFPENPPPPLPPLDAADPEAFATALSARAAYANRLKEEGFTDRPVFITKDEAATLGLMFGKDVPPELKAVGASVVVSAMGPDAEGFFKQIGTTDPIIPHVGALVARGGDQAVALQAMQGQALLDQKVVEAPSSIAVSAGFDDKMRKAFGIDTLGVPGALPVPDGVRDTAVALYAAMVPPDADEATQAKTMTSAWQKALGQSSVLDRTVGGVQEIGGNPALLPPTMSGADLDAAMTLAFGVDSGLAPGRWRDETGAAGAAPSMSLWEGAGNGVPSLGGAPLSNRAWEQGEMFLTPVGGSQYKLTIRHQGEIIDVGVQGQPEGVPFIFDAEKLIDLSRTPK